MYFGYGKKENCRTSKQKVLGHRMRTTLIDNVFKWYLTLDSDSNPPGPGHHGCLPTPMHTGSSPRLYCTKGTQNTSAFPYLDSSTTSSMELLLPEV